MKPASPSRRNHATAQCGHGFTLIELMIVVAIVSILAAIAYPSYRNSVARGARAEAKAALLQNAQFLERNFTVANRYDQDTGGNATSALLPATQTPTSGAAKYTITLATPTTTSYTLTATPTGSMAGDACGSLTLDHQGTRGKIGGSLSVAECWDR